MINGNLGQQPWSPQGAPSYVPGDQGIVSVAQMQQQVSYDTPMSASAAEFSGNPMDRRQRKMFRTQPGMAYSASTMRSSTV